MANTKDSGTNREYATVNTNPGSSGYFTNEINPRSLISSGKTIGGKIFFSVRETGADISANPSALSSVTVILQYKCQNDAAWTDFIPLDGSSLAIGNRLQIEDTGVGVKWRAGVRDDEYISGSVTFGFDW